MYNGTFEHFRKIIEQQKSLLKITETSRRFQEMLKPTQRIINSTQQFTRMADYINTLRIKVPQIHLINPALNEHVLRFNRIRDSIDLFNKNLPKYLVAIASYGWYLDLQTDMDLSVKLANYIEDEDIEKVNTYLIEYYTNDFEKIINKLSVNHPNRIRIFDELRIAFDNEYFNLGIPLILSQIDGICHDYTNKLFFIKNRKDEKNSYLPKVSNELIVINNEFFKAFLAPFFNDAPIFAHEDNLELFPTAFNRHRVLHGLDVDFGTKINFLKAFSLLSYCDDVLIEVIKDSSGSDLQSE